MVGVGHGDADQLEADAGAVGDVVGAGEEDLGQGAADVAAAEQRHADGRGRVGMGRPPHRLGLHVNGQLRLGRGHLQTVQAARVGAGDRARPRPCRPAQHG